MISLAILGVSLVVIFFSYERRIRRLEEEARIERRELTDRIMALSSKPESLATIRVSEEPASLKVIGEDTSWHEETA